MSFNHFIVYVSLLIVLACVKSINCGKSLFKFEIEQENDSEFNVKINAPTLDFQLESQLFQNAMEKFEVKGNLIKPIPIPFNGMLQTNWLYTTPSEVKYANSNFSMPGLFDFDIEYEHYPVNTFQSESPDKHILNVILKVAQKKVTFKYSGLLHSNPSSCPHIELIHNITSDPKDFFSFSSTVHDKCNSSSNEDVDFLSELYQRNVTIKLESQAYPLLQLNLDQIFEYLKEGGWELMEMNSTVLNAVVSANWKMINNEYQHFKKAILSSKIVEWLPSIDISYENDQSSSGSPIEFCLRMPKPQSNSIEGQVKDEL